jgi:hypothetical protein
VAAGDCWAEAGFCGWDCGEGCGAAIPFAGEKAHANQNISGKILARFIPGTKLPKFETLAILRSYTLRVAFRSEF